MTTLSYFDGEGRGLPIRIALLAAGIDFKDERLNFEEYKKRKAEGKIPTGLPILTLASGATVTQSSAILRYAGKKAGMYPTDPEAALRADEIISIIWDIMDRCPHDSDEKKKKEKREKFGAGRMKDLCSVLNDIVKKNGGPYALGKTLTTADLGFLFLANTLSSGNFDYISKTYLQQFPELAALEKAVKASDPVKKWIAKRDADKASSS